MFIIHKHAAILKKHSFIWYHFASSTAVIFVQNECIHRDTKLVYIMLTNSSSSVFSTVECHAKDGCHILPLECQSLYVVTSLFCSLLAVTYSWANSHTRWRQFNNFTNVGAGRTSTLKHGKQNYWKTVFTHSCSVTSCSIILLLAEFLWIPFNRHDKNSQFLILSVVGSQPMITVMY